MGGPLDYIRQLPNAIYVSLVYFPSTCFVVIVFFPLLVFALPIYDVFFYHDYEFLLAVWLPLFGAGGFLGLAMLTLRREKNVLPDEPE